LYYTPTCRRILLDERDWVLAEALHTALGPTGSQSSEFGAVVGTVVGVVGKSHVPGITAAWNAPEATRREKVAKALEEPPPPSRLLALGGGALGLGALVGIARSRTMRRVAGACSLALGGGATWLVVALRDRLDYFERSQKQQAKR
jgi:pheromone shutdown protein TraB